MRHRTLVGLIALTSLLYVSGPMAAHAITCSDQVPVLESGDTDVTTSGILNSDFRAWRAFDDDDDTRWISMAFEVPAWIAYDFDTPIRIENYSILNNAGQNLTSRAPKDFTFEGKNDGDWVILDTRTDQTNWMSGSLREYEVASPGLYSEYRLHVTDDNDSQATIVTISISELQFLDCGTKVFADDFESGDASAWAMQVP